MSAPPVSKIEIIAVGSELLTPHFQDTNSLYLTARLNELGLDVDFKSIVGDDWDDLCLALQNARDRAQIVFVMGGLGPTRDDRTREALAKILNLELILDEEQLQKIEARFRRRGMTMPPVNKKQAFVIDGSRTLHNRNGTAPGIWLETPSSIFILLPGPPSELKPMFESEVWPHLQKFKGTFSVRRIMKIAGLTESRIESLIADVYPEDENVRLTTLAYPGQIEIHILSQSTSSLDQAEKKSEKLIEILIERLGPNVFSTHGKDLEEIIGDQLIRRKKTLSVAESCTGGFLGHRITNVPGSSKYFLGGAVAYSNIQKNQFLAVSLELIERHGSVSAEVACAMSEGIRKKTKSDFGLSITGIAGPDGGTEKKPVGLVYTALSGEGFCDVHKNIFLGRREMIKFQSSQKALDMLRRYLLQSS